jgi:hypothetical protein
VSVSPWSERPADEESGPVPDLHLVGPHEHTWQLRSVEYDDALEVRRYECASCEDVLFR